MTLYWAGCDERLVAAGFLHDCVEDQDVTLNEIGDVFGGDVAGLVYEVTDVSKPEDGNRAFRKGLDRVHLAHASPRGQTLKLSDIISNTRNIAQHDPKFAAVYLEEKRLLLPYLTKGHQGLYQQARELVYRGI